MPALTFGCPQKTYEELAKETKMHVVEMNPQNDYFPKVLASPELPIESSDEPLDFELVLSFVGLYLTKTKSHLKRESVKGGRVPLTQFCKRAKIRPF